MVGKAIQEFNDNQHSLSTTNLTDINKIPKEIISELFEASQVNKVFTQNVPDYEFKDKTSVSSAELLAYMKAIVKENTIFTFGNEK